MRIPQPFLPVSVESKQLSHTVRVLEREYTFGPNGLLHSVKAQGVELLASPMRIVCVEDGGAAEWDLDYANNESESFIQKRDDSCAVICGAMQSERFIVDTRNEVSFDGTVDIDLKFMTRGKTVAQVFGLADVKPLLFKLDKLWLEIPLKKEIATMYHMYPNGPMKVADSVIQPKSDMSGCGKLPEQSVALPFKPFLWLGNEDRGLGWYAESDRYWQPAETDRTMEVVQEEDTVVLRIRLLDSHPENWTAKYENGAYEGYTPIAFHFGFAATPVKTYPKQPYIHNALHIDCGSKIKGNYGEFMSQENRFDRLVEKGVTTLILHEKWNKSQNWFELSEFTGNQLKYICDECHKRGIKVLTYFGYEFSSMAEAWNQMEQIAVMDKNGKPAGGWWRVPFQRAHVVCYRSDYARYFLEGIEKIMDTYHTDGVYLDGTALPQRCYNVNHGCGWYDRQGNLHGSYPVHAVREVFRALYEIVSSRGGQINLHSSILMNYTVLPYVHQTWYGEDVQFAVIKGTTEDVDLDYFRAQYCGRNMGVPSEFIVYENKDLWTYENALASCLIHGVLPRPNDINRPLDVMSKIWKIFDSFPIEKAQWCPYWSNGAEVSDEKVKVSYYGYTTLRGKRQLLVFVANTSAQRWEQVSIKLPEPVSTAWDVEAKQETGLVLDLDRFDYKILYMEE